MAEAAARLRDPIQHTRSRSMLIVGAVVGGVVAGAVTIVTAPVSIPVLLGAAGLGVATGAGMGELAGHFSFMKVVTGEIAMPGSPNVFINGRPAARAHLDLVDCRWHPAHPPVAQGSFTVFINGMPAARKGDRTACDAVILEGSPNVFIGGPTKTTDTISPEVSDRMHKTVQLIGLCSAAVLFGPAVALVGWYASGPIGKAVHKLSGTAFGEGTDKQIAAELTLSAMMVGLAGRGAARGGRAGPANNVLAAEQEAGTIRNINAVGGDMNCVNCAIATDATLAGRPASALGGGPFRLTVLEKEFGNKFGPETSIQNISSAMQESGPGSRGIVFGSRGTNVGHVFNVTNQKGIVRFLDGQTGKAADVSGFDSFRLLRTN
ncbi:PAAR domain-containing protein [Sphingomonas sp.]|uniref:PAAR domain-containing protein n=1 Tax=Sphingomonas sp. TaxID=28214 RepID=UPI003B3A6144